MLTSYQAEPKKPEKATKIDHSKGQKRDTEVANNRDQKKESNRPDRPKKN